MSLAQTYCLFRKQKIINVDKNIKKLENILKALPKKEELEFESQNTYNKANLILANLHTIKPYQKVIEIENYDGDIVKIELEKMDNPSKYTNELFKKAKKLKQKASNISLEELLEGITPENLHGEVETGQAVGKECY